MKVVTMLRIDYFLTDKVICPVLRESYMAMFYQSQKIFGENYFHMFWQTAFKLM